MFEFSANDLISVPFSNKMEKNVKTLIKPEQMSKSENKCQQYENKMAEHIKEEFKNGTHIERLRDDSKFENRTNCRRKWRPLPDVGWFLVFVLSMTSCQCYQEQRFAMEPQDQSAIVGSRVTLPCRVENKAGTVQWTKDDFGLGTHRNLSGYERYAMIGSDEEGDYSLDIRDVALEDDGVYQCQVSSGLNGEPAIRSRYAQLNVLIAPDPPRIIQGAFIDATEDQPVDIECVSVGGKPAAEITWLDGNQAVIKKNVKNSIENMQDDHRFITRSVLRLTPTMTDHNQTITCQAQNTADRAPRMTTVHVEVKYVPKINITVLSDPDGRVPEGSELRIRCDVDSNPLPQIYRWYINNNPVIGDYAEEMIIFNTTRSHNKAVVKCEVSNSVGKNEAKTTLNVTYPPTFRTRPSNVEAEIGKSVILSCDVDGQPKPEIRWLYHEPGRIGQVKGQTPNLKVYVNKETAGRYICKATVKGYPEIESEATIFIKGPPKILSNRTQLGTEGENVRIECESLSVPEPVDVTWFFEGKEISVIHNPEYATVTECLLDGIFRYSLVIKASQSRHYGLYNCSVTNEYGNANVGIVLKPLKTLPLFIILIGVTSGIIIFSAFIILLVICHRRRRNKQISEKPDVTVTGDMYKDSDRSSNISDMKLQLPQSDGSYELDYTSSERSDSKLPAGLPLAGPVSLPHLRDDPLMQFRYSNDYSDTAYHDAYFKAPPAAYIYDYPTGCAPPPHLRVQSPDPPGSRSLQGSLTRSIDTASTLPLSAGNNSQSNSLQRTKNDETDAINSLGLPIGGDNTPPAPVYAQPRPGVDLRYAATYGNPYLRNSSLGYGNQVHTAKPAATPAPPPYSSIRNSVVGPQGNSDQPNPATHV